MKPSKKIKELEEPTAPPPEWSMVNMCDYEEEQRKHLKTMFSSILDMDLADDVNLTLGYGTLEIKIRRRNEQGSMYRYLWSKCCQRFQDYCNPIQKN